MRKAPALRVDDEGGADTSSCPSALHRHLVEIGFAIEKSQGHEANRIRSAGEEGVPGQRRRLPARSFGQHERVVFAKIE